jgi:MFS family permease
MSDEVLSKEVLTDRARPSRAPDRAEQTRAAPLVTGRFAVLLTAQACFGYSFSSFFLLPKYLASELHAGPAEIGLLTAANGAAAVVFMFLMGVMVDRFGRRRFLTAGALLMTAASLAFAAVDEMGPLIYGLRLVQGLAFSMAFVAGATLAVDQASPERLGQTIGIFGLTMLSMNAVAPAVMEEIAARGGWPTAFATAAGGALLCALLSLLVHAGPHRANREAGLASLWQVARRPEQIRAAVVISLVGACFGTLFVFHQLYALELGITRIRVFFVAYAVTAMFARIAFGNLGDRLGRHRVASVTLALYGSGSLAMIALAEVGLAPLGALFGLAHGIFYPTYNATLVADSGATERGKVMALFQGWFNAGLAGGSFLLGFVADARGYPTVFCLAALGVFVALGVLIRGRPRPQFSAPQVRFQPPPRR